MLYQLDTADLAARVRAKRANRPLRALVKEIGPISPATLSRVEQQKAPALAVFLLLCNWLEVSPAVVLRDLHHGPETNRPYQGTAADLTELELFMGLTPTVAYLTPCSGELETMFYEARAAAEAELQALFALDTTF